VFAVLQEGHSLLACRGSSSEDLQRTGSAQNTVIRNFQNFAVLPEQSSFAWLCGNLTQRVRYLVRLSVKVPAVFSQQFCDFCDSGLIL
jgi:hypothetical protein